MARAPVILLLLLLIGQSYCAIDNAGTEFVLSFMDNLISSSLDLDIELYITTTSNNGAMVNVTTPLYDSSWISQVNATRGNIEQVSVPARIRGSDVTKDNKGVYVTASEEVTVYCVNKMKFSTDAFISYPVDSLGSEYIAITWDKVPIIMVVAVTDGTSVTFEISSDYTSTFDYGGTTYNGGDTLTVSLDRYETFHLYSALGDLTGTRVTSTNAIAAFSGNKKTSVTDTNTGSSSDHLVEQLVPTRAWGKEFVSLPSPERTVGDYCRVLASENGTTYTLDGSTYTLDAREYRTHNLPSGSYYYIVSDKAVTVAIFSKTEGTSSNDAPNGGDPAMSIVVPIALFGSDYTWSTVTTSAGDFNNYIIVVSYSNWTSGLVLDDANTSATWESVVGSTDYVATVFDVTPGAHSIYNSAPAQSFLGMAYGNAEYNSYAYASGTRLASINLPCTPTTTVAADGEDNDCDGRIDEETDNGIDDDGDGLIDEDLAAYPRVNGNWGTWQAWSSCSNTCGAGSGTYSRSRDCDSPAPANNGLYCDGDATETGACTGPSTSCPIDGNWGSWGSWGTCAVTCGSGDQARTRSCDTPAAQYGGADCVGNGTETLNCTISDYCLPSFYGNVILGCGNSFFGCATGSITCIDIAFRCDGNVDCDDGTDENEFFAGCDATVCKSAAGGLFASPLLALGAVFLLYLQQRK